MIAISDVGKVAVLDVKCVWVETLTLRLYKNDVEPDEGLPTSQFSESTFPGYAPVNPLDFAPAVLLGSGKAQARDNLRNWTRGAGTGAEDIYGWFITNSAGEWIFAHRTSLAPVPMRVEGQTYSLEVRLTEVTDPT